MAAANPRNRTTPGAGNTNPAPAPTDASNPPPAGPGVPPANDGTNPTIVYVAYMPEGSSLPFPQLPGYPSQVGSPVPRPASGPANAIPNVPQAAPASIMGSSAGATGRLHGMAQILGRLLTNPDGDPAAPSGLTAPLAELLRRRGQQHVARMPAAINTGSLRIPAFRQFWIAYGVAALIILFLLFQATSVLSVIMDDRLTTLQYGDPRTTHLAEHFGLPDESPANKTIVTAQNDGGVGHIFVLPGGKIGKAFVIETPYTGNDPLGRLPLHMEALDLNNDGRLDLFITMGNTSVYFPYIQDAEKGGFRLPTEEESPKLILPGGGSR